MDCSPPGSFVHGILQARIQEWVAFPFSRVFSNPGIEPSSPTLQADSWPAEPQGKPKKSGVGSLSLLQQTFPNQELNRDPAGQADSLPTELWGKPHIIIRAIKRFKVWTGHLYVKSLLFPECILFTKVQAELGKTEMCCSGYVLWQEEEVLANQLRTQSNLILLIVPFYGEHPCSAGMTNSRNRADF